MLTAAEQAWSDDRLSAILANEAREKRRDFIHDAEIEDILRRKAQPEKQEVRAVLAKARSLEGLTQEEAAVLMNNQDPELWQETFQTAHKIKQDIYGNRIVFFAPLYISNPCVNDCVYCGFRHSNEQEKRLWLTQEELAQEVKVLTSLGHKRLMIDFGEHEMSDADFICQCLRTIYGTKNGRGEIRRVNVNAAPLFVDEYRHVKEAGIGTYQIFQETYHHDTYKRVHPPRTLKSVYTWRLFSLHRAQEAGIDDVGIGVLFGLYDWRFEVLALIAHAASLEQEFGAGPHTISIPRIQPANNTPFTDKSPHLVRDDDFKKLVAVIRCSVPYTGMVLTCRERPELRRQVIPLGISQIDAGSRIGIGGYQRMADRLFERAQFQLGDQRNLDDVIFELCQDGYIPSFCTADYRIGRTGCNFMSYAKHGRIKYFCTPNAIMTFKEYLLDYASPRTKEAGEKVISHYLEQVRQDTPQLLPKLQENLKRLEGGERDLYF